MNDSFTQRDVLTGHLAALIPALPQSEYQAAADGFHSLGWRPPADLAATVALLAEHSFTEYDEGDGWNEPRSYEYSCSCKQATYDQWMQRDPEMTGLSVFLEEGRYDAMEKHHAHVAQILLTAGGGVGPGEG